MSDEIILTEANFTDEVLKSELPVLVDFWAEWCGPCKMLAPTIEELAAEYKGQAKTGKLNIDENPTVAEKYGIRGIPTIILFHGGEIVEQAVGVQSKGTLIKMLGKKVTFSIRRVDIRKSGLGKIQRKVIEILKNEQAEHMLIPELTMKVFMIPDDYIYTPAEYSSVFRALYALQDRGLVEVRRVGSRLVLHWQRSTIWNV